MRQLTVFLIFFLFSSSNCRYKPLFLSEDEINHVRADRDNTQTCNDDSLMNFLAEIQVINPESIVKLATLNEITPSCNKVNDNLIKIKNYLGTCKPSTQINLYYQLIKGVDSLYEKICTNSPFKKRFQEVHECLHELENDLDDCQGPADWNENSNNAEICKAYKNIADCYYVKTAKVCGKGAASIAKELLQAIIDSILTIDCTNVKATPLVNDAVPDNFITNTTSKTCVSKSTLTAPIFVAISLNLVFI